MVDQEHPVLGKYQRYGPMISFSETAVRTSALSPSSESKPPASSPS